jgi:hypothetical protein
VRAECPCIKTQLMTRQLHVVAIVFPLEDTADYAQASGASWDPTAKPELRLQLETVPYPHKEIRAWPKSRRFACLSSWSRFLGR